MPVCKAYGTYVSHITSIETGFLEHIHEVAIYQKIVHYMPEIDLTIAAPQGLILVHVVEELVMGSREVSPS